MSRRRLAIVALCVALGGACSNRASDRERMSQAPQRLLAVGASDAAGHGASDPSRDAWPRVLHREAFATGSPITVVGIPGATLDQLIAAVERRGSAGGGQPDVIAVWAAVNDLRAVTTPDQYETKLDRLLRSLPRGARSRVLVANVPSLEALPALAGCSGAEGTCAAGSLRVPVEVVRQVVDAYNQAIARVAAEHQAEVVDLHAASLRIRAEGREREMIGADGFHPSSAGHRSIAREFARVLGSAPARAASPRE